MRSEFSNQDGVSEQKTTGWLPGRGSVAVACFVAPRAHLRVPHLRLVVSEALESYLPHRGPDVLRT